MSTDGAILQHYGDGSTVSRKFERKREKLICTCSPFTIKGHCLHIKEAMTQRRDAGTLPSAPNLVQVPIFAKPKFHILCELLASNTPVRKIRLPSKVDDFIILGLASEGMGRADLRVMFLEWVIGQIEVAYHTEVTACPSPHHTGNKGVLSGWDPEAKGQAFNDMVADYWLVRISDECGKCKIATTTDI